MRHLVGHTKDELRQIVAAIGQPAYRGEQLSQWLYEKSARSLDQMTNLPAALREQLAEGFSHPPLKIAVCSPSEDGVRKYLLELHDGNKIECVFLPYEDRTSICISTQVGCAMNCSFCATGIGGLTRDLTAAEIVDQVLLTQADTGKRITNVVYMGMGEPLANYSNTVKSLHLLNDQIGIAARKITVSTVGLPGAIRDLAEEGMQLTLAISIHAPTDEIRQKIMPVNQLHPLEDLLDACRLWIDKTNRRITFEYLLLDQINDAPIHAVQLAELVHPLLANVNVIPYNHVEGRGEYRRPSRERIDAFKSTLEEYGVTVTERMRRGNPVDAACGQLRHESESGRKLAGAPKE